MNWFVAEETKMTETKLQELRDDLINALDQPSNSVHDLRKLIERAEEAVFYFLEERNERANTDNPFDFEETLA